MTADVWLRDVCMNLKMLSPDRWLFAALPFFLVAAGSVQAQNTRIVVTSQVKRNQVHHFGLNLSGQNYYDSGQILRNLVSRNPGFEGGTWQSILHCKTFSQNICTDENSYTTWPTDFLAGAHYEVLSGRAAGATGTVVTQDAAAPPSGVRVRLSPVSGSVSDGDYVLVRIDKPGHPEAGWWLSLNGGAASAAETHDLSPSTQGHQALRLDALVPGSNASLHSIFDSLDGHSFVQLHRPYQLSFRAKPLSGKSSLHVHLQRQDLTHGLANFLDKNVALTSGWHDYHIDFPANDRPGAIGHMDLAFDVNDASILLDDVSLTPVTVNPTNRTAFRDEVVSALRDLEPGTLRYMDNGTSFGSSLDNLLTPEFARQRAGYSTQEQLVEDIPIGIPDFLMLCEAVHADPWITVPPGLSPVEMQHLVEYLAGPTNTPYGQRRAALGHAQPWTSVFQKIHLELGNEQWNARSFAGGTINHPTAYAQRAAQVFQAARTSPYFRGASFDLVAGSWFASPWWTEQELATLNATADTLSVAPYLFYEYNSAPNPGIVFGDMFAQPEQYDSRPDGTTTQQAHAVATAAHPTKLAVYEVNLGTAIGAPTITQTAINLTVPSVGGGLAVADHMLLMLRDLGIDTQCVFALTEFQNSFASSGGPSRTTPLWGITVDMGGATNRRRPVYLAEQILNRAMLSNMLVTQQDGANPQWSVNHSSNDHISIQGAHEIQSFAFAEGSKHSLVVFNLSRDYGRPVSFDGPNAPSGTVHQTVLTAEHVTDSNEDAEHVRPVTTTVPAFQSHATHTLPPFSMTVYTWESGR